AAVATGRTRAALDGALERRARAEARNPARRDLNPLTGLGVDALTRATVSDRELAEPGERDLAAAGKGLLNDLKHRIDGLTRLALAEARLVCDLIDELLLCHRFPLLCVCGWRS